MAEVRTLTVDVGEDGVRLDRWFRRRWPHLSQGQIQKLARSGQIRVDGGRAKADTRLAAGATISRSPKPCLASGISITPSAGLGVPATSAQ